KRWRTTLNGTLPARKPLRRRLLAAFCNRAVTSFSTCSAGTPMVIRRSRPDVASMETCMDLPHLCALYDSIEFWCEKGDSNSHRLPHWNLNPARLPVPPFSPQLLPAKLLAGKGGRFCHRGALRATETGPTPTKRWCRARSGSQRGRQIRIIAD